MYNIMVPSLEEDMALIGLTEEDMGREQLNEDADDSSDDDVTEAFGDSDDDDDRGSSKVLSRVREALGTLIESVEEEDASELTQSYGLVSEIAVSLAEAFAEMNDDGVLSEAADDSEEIVTHLTDLARACLEMSEALEEGMDADGDVYEQLAENIEAVLGGIEIYEGILAEMGAAPFEDDDEEVYDDEDEDEDE